MTYPRYGTAYPVSVDSVPSPPRISQLTMSTDADNKEVSRRMLGGWKMLAKSCDTPGCYMPMLQSRDGQVRGGQADGGEKTPGRMELGRLVPPCCCPRARPCCQSLNAVLHARMVCMERALYLTCIHDGRARRACTQLLECVL